MLDSTGKGIDGEVARLIESQRVIDSVNHDPRANGRELDEYDMPPAPFTTPVGRGYYIQRSCGDCTEASLLFGRPGSIADISFNMPDDVPKGLRTACEMTVVGKTFQWRGKK
ncbi:hypothetical protein BH09GEM1_BH09GEM1_27970 [soil metagenome]